MVGAVQDVSEARLADHEIAARVAVSAVLADWDGFEVDGKRLLGELAEAMDFAFGALWLPAGDLLSAHVVWSDSAMLTTPGFDEATRELRIPRSGNLPGVVWECRLPVGIDDVVSDRSYRRRQAAALPSLSTSGETLTIEESMTLRARTETAGDVGVEHEWSRSWA